MIELTIELEKPFEYNEGDGDDTINLPIALVIERLTARLNSVPPEYRDRAMLKIWGSGENYSSVYLEAYYSRPETDAERLAREAKERDDAANKARKLDAHERATYERLKTKFAQQSR